MKIWKIYLKTFILVNDCMREDKEIFIFYKIYKNNKSTELVRLIQKITVVDLKRKKDR